MWEGLGTSDGAGLGLDPGVHSDGLAACLRSACIVLLTMGSRGGRDKWCSPFLPFPSHLAYALGLVNGFLDAF